MIELLASRLGRNDEKPNIELAEKLCATSNTDGVREIAGLLAAGGNTGCIGVGGAGGGGAVGYANDIGVGGNVSGDGVYSASNRAAGSVAAKSAASAIASDCIKVLYEVGQRRPELIADYADDFITALFGINNRIIWGSMTALAYIAPIRPEPIFARLREVVAAYRSGSVITVDNSISVFAHLCKANTEYCAKVFPILLDHLANCRAKEIPQHAERMSVCINSSNKQSFTDAINARLQELSTTQKSRIANLLKKL